MLDSNRNAFWRISFACFALVLSGIMWSYSPFDPNIRVESMLIQWGNEAPPHYIGNPDPGQVAMGRDLITQGRTQRNGKNTLRISPFFVCTDCHNLEPEYFNFSEPTATGRLEFAKNEQADFLPASSFYGMVNQPSWYNHDYEKKYGDLVTAARHSFVGALQLCAQECSQGRILKDWEVTALLHYLWSIDLKVSDLHIPPKKWNQIAALPTSQRTDKIRSYLPTGNAAHFSEKNFWPQEEIIKTPIDNGKYIYQFSCLRCHSETGPTKFKLIGSVGKEILRKNLYDYKSRYNLFNVVRFGTHPLPGKKAYMPQYTLEKMNDDQLKSLASYILQYDH